jgi:uncharacterized membrane protein
VSIGGNPFGYYVTLSDQVSPSSGLTVAFNPPTLYQGESTVTFRSSTPGSYTVTITGTYGSRSQTVIVHVTVAVLATGTPDVTLDTGVKSLSLNSGASGTITITVAPQNGFMGTITLAVAAPAGVSCSLNPTSIRSSGTSTLTCKGSTVGDYAITITATGGSSPHSATVNVNVSNASPAAPAPSTILGLSQAVFYVIIGVIIIVVVAGTVFVLRRTRRSGS